MIYLKENGIHVEKIPETNEAKAWENLQKRLENLGKSGYAVTHATDGYVILQKKYENKKSMFQHAIENLEEKNAKLRWKTGKYHSD